MPAGDANARRRKPPRFLSSYHFLLGGHLATFNLTAFVFIVQEYGRKHVGVLAEGQGEGQGEWQGGLYSIVQE